MANIILLSSFDYAKSWLVAMFQQNNIRTVAMIIDAKTPRLNADPSYVHADKLFLEAAGIVVRSMKLEDEEDLDTVIDEADAIYIKGGSSFYLLNAVRKSGFEAKLKQVVTEGKLYIGESAGAYIACPTIEMAHWKQQDRDIVGMDDLTGLNLVPFLVSAHYTEELQLVLEPYIQDSKLEVKLLHDNEVILYEDGISKTIRV